MDTDSSSDEGDLAKQQHDISYQDTSFVGMGMYSGSVNSMIMYRNHDSESEN